MYKPCSFDRKYYLDYPDLFDDGRLVSVDDELGEFNNDIECLAYELAHSRYRIAKLEEGIKEVVDFGLGFALCHITISREDIKKQQKKLNNLLGGNYELN